MKNLWNSNGVVFSPCGTCVAVAGTSQVMVWNVSQQQLLAKLSYPKQIVQQQSVDDAVVATGIDWVSCANSNDATLVASTMHGVAAWQTTSG